MGEAFSLGLTPPSATVPRIPTLMLSLSDSIRVGMRGTQCPGQSQAALGGGQPQGESLPHGRNGLLNAVGEMLENSKLMRLKGAARVRWEPPPTLQVLSKALQCPLLLFAVPH